eukprot:NODE_11_length_54881_cov_1.430718.p20 type:complete len:312 gc:universal NODE_11_length_54881_cov_1.430718:28571-27636(-)
MNKNILELAYRQSIVWIGTALAPSVIYLSIVGYFVIFWVKTLVLRSLGSPPRRIYNAHKQTMYFLVSLIAAFFVVIGPFIYGFVMTKPGYCGPGFIPAEQDIKTCDYLYWNASRPDSFGLCVYNNTESYRGLDLYSGSSCSKASNVSIGGSSPRPTTEGMFLSVRGDLRSDNTDVNNKTSQYNNVFGYEDPLLYQTLLNAKAFLGVKKSIQTTYNKTQSTSPGGSFLILQDFLTNSNDSNSQTESFRKFLSFVISPIVLLVAILCMGVWIYYLKAIAIKRNRRVIDLEVELESEREEKRALLKKLRKYHID